MDLNLYDVLKQHEKKILLILEEYHKKEILDQETKRLMEERDFLTKEMDFYELSSYMKKDIKGKIDKIQEMIDQNSAKLKEIKEKIDSGVGIPKNKIEGHRKTDGSLKREIQEKIKNRQSNLDKRLERCEQEKETEKDPERIRKLEILIKGFREQTKTNCARRRTIESIKDMKWILDQYIKERQKQDARENLGQEIVAMGKEKTSAEVAKSRLIRIKEGNDR